MLSCLNFLDMKNNFVYLPGNAVSMLILMLVSYYVEIVNMQKMYPENADV